MFVIQKRNKYHNIFSDWKNIDLYFDKYEDAVLSKPFNVIDDDNNGIEYKISEII